ncbi:addiction module protein [Salinisphaera hydrothermalis]|uniref:addiction module protein n=1 Tax=Salinisphaera hydrothermalis TaxID=563188 RepID=UPI00334065B9
MTPRDTTESIEREMLRLGPEVRARLVHSLVKSLGNLSTAELESLWLDEAERRDAELESGSVEAVPGDEAIARIRSRHGF